MGKCCCNTDWNKCCSVWRQCSVCAYWLIHACGLNRFGACMYVYRNDCGHVCASWCVAALCQILSEWWSQGGLVGRGMWNVWGEGETNAYRLLVGKILRKKLFGELEVRGRIILKCTFPICIAANCSWSFVYWVIILCVFLLPYVHCFTVCVLLSYIL